MHAVALPRPKVAPVPTGAPRVKIALAAALLCDTFGFVPGGDVHALVGRMGGHVLVRSRIGLDHRHVRAPLAATVHASDDFVVETSVFASRERARLDVARGIGFLMLHYELVRDMRPEAIMTAHRHVEHARDDAERMAWMEADAFAAELMMPEDVFRDLASDGSDVTVARLLGVPVGSVGLRRRALHIA